MSISGYSSAGWKPVPKGGSTGYGSGAGATAQMVASISAETRGDYDVLIYLVGSVYYAIDWKGNTLSSSTVFSTVWNATVTAGTTRKKKVVVVGNITITAACTGPSNIAIDASGASFTRSGTGYHMFHFNTKSNIEWKGGIINSAAKNPEAYDTNEMVFTACTDVLVDGIRINDAAEDGIRIVGACNNCKVVNSSFYDANRHPILVAGTGPTNIVIANNYINGCIIYDGITLYMTNGEAISITGNTIEDVDGSATSSAAIQLEELGSNDTNTISCTGNTIRNCQYGIGVASSMRPVTIVGNAIEGCNDRGIFLQNTLRSTISGNTIDQHNLTSANSGIYIYGARECTISNNAIWGATAYTTGIKWDASGIFDECTISGNTFMQCYNAILDTGLYNTYVGNIFGQGGRSAIVISTGDNQYCQFIGNTFSDNGQTTDATYYDFDIGGSAGNNMYGLKIIANQSLNNSANRIAYFINISSAANTNNCEVLYNRQVGARTGFISARPSGGNYMERGNSSAGAWVDEAQGTDSIASGTTATTITHGLGYTPTRAEITITLGENPTNTPGAIWVDTIGATTFAVNCENDPGASNLDFSWSVRKV